MSTMKVRVNGEIEERPIYRRDQRTGLAEPELKRNEECIWAMGDTTPIIIKIYEDEEI